MQDKANYFKHSICLTAVFLFSSFIISKNNTEGLVLSLIVAFILSILLPFLLKNRTLSFKISNKPFINNLFIGIFISFCFLCLVSCQSDYIVFTDKIRLPNTLAVVLSGIFSFLALYLGWQSEKIIFTFSLFVYIISAISIILIFIFSISIFDLKIFTDNLNSDLLAIIKGAIKYLVYGFGQLIIVAVFLKFNDCFSKKRIFIGMTFGFIIIAIIILNIILAFNSKKISQLEYPYPSVSGIVTLGRSQSRIDGILYFVYFASALLKTSVIFSVITRLLKGYKRIFGTIILSILTLFAVILSASHQVNRILNSDIIGIILLVLEVTVFSVFVMNLPKRRID